MKKLSPAFWGLFEAGLIYFLPLFLKVHQEIWVSNSHGIAERYPGDRGIDKDPDVLYAENFADGLPSIFSRYQDILNGEGMSLVPDKPAGSSATSSIKMTNLGGINTGGHLFKVFRPGFDSVVHLRYYVKYPLSSKGSIHHEGIWIGGYNPVTDYPNPRAGLCGIDGRLSISYEPSNDVEMGTYNYWSSMKSWNGGSGCYGNNMLADNNSQHQLHFDQWTCIELRIKMNSPATESNGELTVWQDGIEVGNWGPGFPNGRWTKDRWTKTPTDIPFEGFRWRKDPALNLNYLWIEFYDDKTRKNESHSIGYSNIVLAKKYIGPISK